MPLFAFVLLSPGAFPVMDPSPFPAVGSKRPFWSVHAHAEASPRFPALNQERLAAACLNFLYFVPDILKRIMDVSERFRLSVPEGRSVPDFPAHMTTLYMTMVACVEMTTKHTLRGRSVGSAVFDGAISSAKAQLARVSSEDYVAPPTETPATETQPALTTLTTVTDPTRVRIACAERKLAVIENMCKFLCGEDKKGTTTRPAATQAIFSPHVLLGGLAGLGKANPESREIRNLSFARFAFTALLEVDVFPAPVSRKRAATGVTEAEATAFEAMLSKVRGVQGMLRGVKDGTRRDDIVRRAARYYNHGAMRAVEAAVAGEHDPDNMEEHFHMLTVFGVQLVVFSEIERELAQLAFFSEIERELAQCV